MEVELVTCICNYDEQPAPILMNNPKHTIYIIAHVRGSYDEYVVHRHFIGHYGSSEMEPNFIENKSLAALRKIMKGKQLHVQERTFGDDPLIVEKWI